MVIKVLGIWVLLLTIIGPGSAQTNFNFSVTHNTSFVDILQDMAINYDLDFAYPSDAFKDLTLPASNYECIHLEEALTWICSQADAEYKILDRDKILIRKVSRSNENLPSKNPFTQEYTLLPLEVNFQPITILGFQPFMMLNGIRFNPEDSYKAGGFLGTDILKTLQMSSGIAADHDYDADVRIRGSQGDETLVILDEIPIINANHFWGIFSNINDRFVEDVQLYKNALPISYSGRTGGMVWMKSADHTEKFGGEFLLGLLTTSAKVDIPMDALSIHLAVRTSSDKILDIENEKSQETQFKNDVSADGNRRKITISSSPEFQFHDVNAKFNVRFNEGSNLQLNLFSSVDEYSLFQSFEFTTIVKDKIFGNEKSYVEYADWRNKGASLVFHKSINEKWTNQSVFAYASYKDANTFTNSLKQGRPDRDDLTSRVTHFNSFISHQLKNESIYKVSSIHSLRLGAEFKLDRTYLNIERMLKGILSIDKNEQEYHLFGSNRFSLSDQKWITDIGLRTTYYSGTETIYWQPQLSTRYIKSDHLFLKASASRQIQFANELTHEDAYGRSFTYITLSNNSLLPVKTSHNFMLGFETNFSSWTLDLEAYYKDIDGKIQHLTNIPGFIGQAEETNNEGYKIIKGSGEVIGVDLSLHYRHKSFNSGVEYTLSKATDVFKSVYNGKPFPSADDRRHQLKWLNGFEVSKFNFYANYIYASGKPYNDLSLLMDGEDRDQLDSDAFIKFLPFYGRMDIGMSRNFTIKNMELEIGVHIYNLTNRKNVHALQYIYAIPNAFQSNPAIANTVLGSEVDQLDRTFNIQLGISF